MSEAETSSIGKRTLPWMALTMIIAAIGLLSIASFAVYFFGSLGAAMAYLGGDRLIADAYTRSIGTVEGGEKHAVFFKLSNLSSQAITILGAKSSCTCVAVDQLPVTLPPQGVFRLRIGVRPKFRPGQIAERVSLLTDREDQRRLNLAISGRVLDRGGPPTARTAIAE